MTEPSRRRGMEALDGPFDPFAEQESISGQQSFAFPSSQPLRLTRTQDLARLKTPNDLPSQLLESMRNKPKPKWIVNYPTRLFHLKPQSNLRISDDLDWETTFLWQKVSSQRVQASWIQALPVPALDLPLELFPQTLLRQGATMRTRESTPRELLDFATAVLNTSGTETAAALAPAAGVPLRNIKGHALHIIKQFERLHDPEAVAMAARVRAHEQAKAEMQSFIRFRDSERKPTGMGFRTAKDMLFLDDQFLTDFLRRARQHGLQNRRMRSDVKLVCFLNSQDAAKIRTIAVSSSPFQNPPSRHYLCYSIARTFPNLERLFLASIGVFDNVPEHPWYSSRQFSRLRRLEKFAADEVDLGNGGRSFSAQFLEDPTALFDPANMSTELKKATGAHANGRGRALAGTPARTPIVAHGVKAGLLRDPASRHRDQQPAPLVGAVQRELSAAFADMLRGKQEAARASRAEALSRLEGRRTRLPRPSAPGATTRRRYRREEPRVEPRQWVWAHYQKARRRYARPDDDSSSEPESEASVAADEVVSRRPGDSPRVEPFVLAYDRGAFDRIVQDGWVGFGPGVDLSHLSRR
ncbi:hypothetical protein Daus18300_003000 [Diaporthe australafricana]|uniref:Uncharacterized protein n=1 Tax=Diaporthe australafricana TaxID=127596 RepID=A0ABR3XJL7_9PEZI